jgi:hypothetical protein
MKKIMLSLGLALALGAAGCASVTASSQLAPGTNVAKYKTFGFYSPPGQSGKPVTMAEQQVRSALTSDLQQKGFVEAQPGTQPDFLISYQGRRQQKVDVTPGYYGWYGYGGFPDVTTYTEGTLIVDFVDPQTNTVFWRGTASGVMNHPNDPDLAMIDKGVAKMLTQYPSQMASTPRQPM